MIGLITSIDVVFLCRAIKFSMLKMTMALLLLGDTLNEIVAQQN
jgi:hypothetical protein